MVSFNALRIFSMKDLDLSKKEVNVRISGIKETSQNKIVLTNSIMNFWSHQKLLYKL